MIIHWLNIIRWQNILIILLAHFLCRLSLLHKFIVDSILSEKQYVLLSISILCITASGNIINDIYDITSDKINNRKRPIACGWINTSNALLTYSMLNLIAIVIGIYLSVKLSSFLLIFIQAGVILILFIYTKHLKGIPLLGNMVISILVSLSFLLPLIIGMDKSIFYTINPFLLCLLFYGIFAFWSNLNREIIKDVIDIKGDYAVKMKTIPILLGKKRTNKILFTSTIMFIFFLLYALQFLQLLTLPKLIYYIVGVVLPLLIFLFRIMNDGVKVNYNFLSNLYKIVMFLGLCSLILFL